MGGPPSRSMWIAILLTIARMPVNSAQQFPELQPRTAGLLPMTRIQSSGKWARSTGFLQSSFFVGLTHSNPNDKTTDPEHRIQNHSTHHLNVSTASYPATLPVSVPSRTKCREHVPSISSRQKQSQQIQPTSAENNEVEYCYDFDFLCDKPDFLCNTYVSVKDRLKHAHVFWETVLRPSDYILNVIKSGYRLEFDSIPNRAILNNNRSALDNEVFVEHAITELLKKHLVQETPFPPYCVNPLTVSAPVNKKPRLILDLRHVNACVSKRKVKFEGSREGLFFAVKGNYMIKFDLTSGYHHVNIHPDHFKYLGFSWKFHNKVRYFVFTVLPFGLSSAGYIFTKILRPLVAHWRSKACPVIMYLDDGWLCSSRENCIRMSIMLQKDLESAGFLINQEKSVWSPVRVLEWLGFQWDLNEGCINIPKQKP